MEYETEFIVENPIIKAESANFPYTKGLCKKRPVNTLDVLHFQSDGYVEYKLSQRIKNAINSIDLEYRYVEEIIELCKFYAKKVESPHLSDLISIVTYKIIKHYHLPIPTSELIKKTKLDKGKFLKFAKLISVITKQDQQNQTSSLVEHNEHNFSQSVYDYLTFLITKLSEYTFSSPDIFKVISKKCNDTSLIENLTKKLISSQFSLSSNLFTDIQSKLNEIKSDAKNLIYKNNDKLDVSYFNFYEFFGNKILIENLSAAMIKFFLERKGIRVQLDIFKDKFRLCPSGISKGIKMMKEYTNLIYTINDF